MDDEHTHSNSGGAVRRVGAACSGPASDFTEALSGPICEPVDSYIDESDADEFIPGLQYAPPRLNRNLRSRDICDGATFGFGPELPEVPLTPEGIEAAASADAGLVLNIESQRSAALPSKSQAQAAEHPQRILIRDRYRLGQVIGSDRDGTIYRARDLRRDNSGGATDIAIKILDGNASAANSALARLKREFAHAQELSHPGIVRVFDIDFFDGQWFVTMELVEGPTLESVLRDPALSPSRRAAIKSITACAQALIYAHSRGILHCNLSPASIVMSRDDGVKIRGFGTAPAFGPDFAGCIDASLNYCSPNVLRGERPDPRDDVFSFACITYEWLTGQHPFVGLAVEAEANGAQIQRRPGLTGAQFKALKQALCWDRDQRTETIADFLAALRLESHTESAGSRMLRGRRSNPVSSLQVFATLQYLKSRAKRLTVREFIATGAAAAVLVAIGLVSPSRKPSAATVLPTQVHSPIQSAGIGTPGPAQGQLMNVALQTKDQPQFAPRSSGAGEAASDLPSNRRSQVISLKDTDITVSSRASMVVIPLLRGDGDTGPLRIRWRTVPGSARPDVDYAPVSSGTARFLDRQSQQVLYVPLINHAAHRGDRTFAVRLQKVIGDAQLGITTAHITIHDES